MNIILYYMEHIQIGRRIAIHFPNLRYQLCHLILWNTWWDLPLKNCFLLLCFLCWQNTPNRVFNLFILCFQNDVMKTNPLPCSWENSLFYGGGWLKCKHVYQLPARSDKTQADRPHKCLEADVTDMFSSQVNLFYDKRIR